MFHFNKNKRALSLIEMLIVLLILSTTVLSAFGIILRANLEIKENEIKDTVNSLMISINEAVKTPVKIQLKNFSQVNFVSGTEYAFKVEQQNGIYLLTYVTGSPSLTSCNSTSPFKYNLDLPEKVWNVDACVLVSIKKSPSTGPAKYEIKTNTLYTFTQADQSPTYSYLIANRYDEFEYI